MDLSNEDKPESNLSQQPTIDDRIKELRDEGHDNAEIARILHQEGYGTHEIMKRRLPLKALKTKPSDDDSVMGAITGTTKGPGYLDEFKMMIQRQIGRSRELTEVFYNIGLGTLLASLSKSGMGIEEFRKIALKQEGLREALEKAGETAFKALEYYQSNLITKVETERDEARAYSSLLETEVSSLKRNSDPKFRLEKMIHTCIFSGNVDPNTLMALIDKWLSIELAEIKLEMLVKNE